MHFRPLIVGVHSLGRCPLNAGVLLEAGSCLSISSVPNPCWLKISSGVPNICNIILESIIIHCANPYQPTIIYIYTYCIRELERVLSVAHVSFCMFPCSCNGLPVVHWRSTLQSKGQNEWARLRHWLVESRATPLRHWVLLAPGSAAFEAKCPI